MLICSCFPGIWQSAFPHRPPDGSGVWHAPSEVEPKGSFSRLTRHELKEQIQHDAFSDSVSKVVHYSTTHRDTLIKWGAVVVAVAVIAIAAVVYTSYQRGEREKDLAAAFEVISAPVGPANQFGKTFPTEAAKRDASIKALAHVVAKDGGTDEGRIAQYYLGTLKAQNDPKGAEADLKAVADSRAEVSSLAKVALAQLYAGENRLPEAQQLLQSLAAKPNSLVSKGQADILRAQIDAATNPQQAKQILQSLQNQKQDPAIARAAGELAAQVTR